MHIKHNLLDYEFLLPPLKLNYYDWTKKEAEKYFSWFLKQVPVRAEYVLSKATENLVHCCDDIVDSPETLRLVWSWFLSVAMLEKVPMSERLKNHGIFAKFGESFFPSVRLSACTELLVHDIGMFLGYLYTKNCSCLKWEVLAKPKNHVLYNHPVLTGFVDMDYSPPFHAKMDPIHMVGVQAVKLVHGSAKDTDLCDLYMKWKKKIPLD